MIRRLPFSVTYIIFIIFIAFITIILVPSVFAQSLSVSLTVKNTYFVVNGLTSPSSMVTITEDSSVLATAQAASDGSFSLSILTDAGVHDFGLYTVDSDGHDSATITITVSLTENSTTTMDNIIIPPTVVAPTDTTYTVGSPIALSGRAVPDSTIRIVNDNVPVEPTLTVSPNGSWATSLDTSNLGVGTHSVVVNNLVTGGYESESSIEYTFTITSLSSPSPASPSPLLSPSTTPIPSSLSPLSPLTSPFSTPSPCILPSWGRLFDINHDCTLSYHETITLLNKWMNKLTKYYLNNPNPGVSPDNIGECDFNDDKTCNIVDLSVLLYYVNR